MVVESTPVSEPYSTLNICAALASYVNSSGGLEKPAATLHP